ncbi:hypothetical protein TRFO_28378 [Tritrichomonas foetus]|uniref:BAR domain-containing protein n=1 Tax=Tritrichomonas foetus TaxID=1144522 RepID=A0A1J4JZ03_9EUKA|nr:hypothetical protein TRFO_28378 [Tritrichomonas foetus]|eukprot:OHT04203.1 hypothetical protein TRFO_28378 [Tritrichomonas foetus]
MKKIKHDTTIIMEKVKIKSSKAEVSKNPEYNIAVKHYKEIKNHVGSFISIIEKISVDYGKLFNVSINLTESISTTVHGIPTGEKIDSVDKLNDLSHSLQSIVGEKVVNEIQHKVVTPLKDFLNNLKEASKQKKICTDNQLILASNIEKLSKLKKNNQNIKRIAEYENKVEVRSHEVNNNETAFITTISNLYDNRFHHFIPIINSLVSILHNFTAFAGESSNELRFSVGPELNHMQFTSGNVPAISSDKKTNVHSKKT